LADLKYFGQFSKYWLISKILAIFGQNIGFWQNIGQIIKIFVN